MDTDRARPARFRVYQVIGFVVGILFLALAAAAYFGGGGPVVALIALIGGVLCLAATVTTIVRNRQ